MAMKRMADLDLDGRRVLIREDLNVPVADGLVTSDARIRRALPTLQQALDAGAAVMVLSHLGRPKEGQFEERFSLAPVARQIGHSIRFEDAFFGVTSQDVWRLMSYEYDTDRGQTTLHVDRSQLVAGFRLDISLLNGSETLL